MSAETELTRDQEIYSLIYWKDTINMYTSLKEDYDRIEELFKCRERPSLRADTDDPLSAEKENSVVEMELTKLRTRIEYYEPIIERLQLYVQDLAKKLGAVLIQ